MNHSTENHEMSCVYTFPPCFGQYSDCRPQSIFCTTFPIPSLSTLTEQSNLFFGVLGRNGVFLLFFVFFFFLAKVRFLFHVK